jgi:isopenicillin-N N-acyltransferase-like protein
MQALTSPIEVIELQGAPFERGRIHGKRLARSIRETVAIYQGLFQRVGGPDREGVRTIATTYGEQIKAFNADYFDEISGIADGAELDVRDILAINSRTEILTTLLRTPAECTSFCFTQECVLAQTWDWLRELDGKPVLLRIRYDDDHTVLTMTEPGMVGKVGINSAGLGVALNILVSPDAAQGCPVHVLLRAALDARSWDEAYERLTKFKIGTNSAITLADDRGRCVTCEYRGGRVTPLHPKDGLIIHTNHYLSQTTPCPILDSEPRYARATDLISGLDQRTVEAAMQVLSDRSAGSHAICVPWHDEDVFGDMGTVACVVSNLKSRTLYIARGSPAGVTQLLPNTSQVDLRYDAFTL